MPIRTRNIIIIAVTVILLAALAAYGLYREQQKRALRDNVATWLSDAGTQLSAALAADPVAGETGEQELLAAADARSGAVARPLAALRALEDGLRTPQIDAAEHYLLGVREILRLHAASRRHRYATTAGLRELWEYMGSRYTQGPGWTTEAVRRKALLEKEYAQYRTASDALSRLLEGYPQDRARLAPLADTRQLPDESAVNAARARVLDAARQMAAEMERLRKLPRP